MVTFHLMRRRFWFEFFALLAAAVLCAAVSNLLAARERKLAWLGTIQPAPKITTQNQTVPVPPAPVVPQPVVSQSRPTTIEQTPLATNKSEQPNPVEMKPRLSSQTFSPHPDRPWVETTSEETWSLYNQGVLVLDARRTEEYSQAHIAAARSFAVWESDIETKIAGLTSEFPSVIPVLVYCSGGACEDSKMLAEKLFNAGFVNVYVYTDGFPDWQAKGHPVEQGMPLP